MSILKEEVIELISTFSHLPAKVLKACFFLMMIIPVPCLLVAPGSFADMISLVLILPLDILCTLSCLCKMTVLQNGNDTKSPAALFLDALSM